MIFDKNEYFELLELEKKYNKRGKSFFEEDFDNYGKLIEYQANLSTTIYWRNAKTIYNDLLKLDNKICCCTGY